jgi:hypothetical protein
MTDFLLDRVVEEFKDPTTVSTLEVLFPFKTFGERLQSVSVYVINTGAAPVTVILEGSETGLNTDPEKTFTKVAAPGEQVSFDLDSGNMLVTNWRLSAQTESPAFPVSSVKFKVKAQVLR